MSGIEINHSVEVDRCRSRLLSVDHPALPNANNSKSNDCADDEEAYNRHEAVEVAPPAGALVSPLVNSACGVDEFRIRPTKLILAIVASFQHFQRGLPW